MAHKEKIRQDYFDKLTELGVASQFMNNLKLQDMSNSESIRLLNLETTFNDFIVTAFNWEKTPEGVHFWDEIAQK